MTNNAVYLHEWKDSGLFGMIMDFEGVWISENEFHSLTAPYSNVEAWEERKKEAATALEKEDYRDIDVLLASYHTGGYEGDAFVLFKKNGKLFEVHGSHCSCYGLERQWQPEETTVESIRHRLATGTLGYEDYSGNKFALELSAILNRLEDQVTECGSTEGAKRP